MRHIRIFLLTLICCLYAPLLISAEVQANIDAQVDTNAITQVNREFDSDVDSHVHTEIDIVDANCTAQSDSLHKKNINNDSISSENIDSEAVDNLRLTTNQKRDRRGLTDLSNIFIPKGQWIFGGTASFSTHTNNKYTYLIVDGINSTGHTFKVSPLLAYAFKSNMAAGGRFIYSRTLLKIDDADLAIGGDDSGFNVSVNDYYAIKQTFSVGAIWRQYIPLGHNKRFAFFNEVQLSMGHSQSKFTADSPVKGTFSNGYDIGLGISPGIVAFATNDIAIELNIGVMGVSYSSVEQVHNQVTVGEKRSSMMNFKVNLFSIGLGASFYL